MGVLRYLTFAALLLSLGSCSSTRIADLPIPSKPLPPEIQARFAIGEPTEAVLKVKRKAKVAGTKKKKGPPPFSFPDRRSTINPIWVGERQVLEVTYIGIKAGEFTLDVLPFNVISERSVYHLRAHAVSSSLMNLFYSLNDTIESFWDFEGLFSHRFHLVLDQTKQKRDSLELYDSETKKTFYWNRRNHVDKGISETKETFDFPEVFPQDSFSALYYVRTLPLEDGKVYTFPVVSEGKEWDAEITVVRREMQEVPDGKKMCIVLKVQTRYQGMLQQEKDKGDTFIWLTDDDRRFIARVEAHVKVGEVAARLTHVDLGERPHVE